MLFLKVLFSFIFVFMIYSTTQASLQLNLFKHLPTLIQDPWAVMTLYDAYFAFLFFYLWVFYKESSWFLRVLWFALIMMFGTIAMSLYMLIKLFGLGKEDGIQKLLMKES